MTPEEQERAACAAIARSWAGTLRLRGGGGYEVANAIARAIIARGGPHPVDALEQEVHELGLELNKGTLAELRAFADEEVDG
jgi:hypothetical protein